MKRYIRKCQLITDLVLQETPTNAGSDNAFGDDRRHAQVATTCPVPCSIYHLSSLLAVRWVGQDVGLGMPFHVDGATGVTFGEPGSPETRMTLLRSPWKLQC